MLQPVEPLKTPLRIPPSSVRKIARFFVFILCFTLLLSGCGPERVILTEPKEDDLITLNGCVISACNYLALVKTKHTLEANFWTKILLVRYDNHPAGHAYCVWETDGTIYGYDRNSGGFPIPVYTRDPRAIAIVLAQELSKFLNQPLTVKSADFVEPGQAALYSYSISPGTRSAAAVANTAPFRAHKLSLSDSNDSFTRE